MYLIYGESFRLIEFEINKIVGESQNIISVDLSSSSLMDVLTEATYVSMFQEKKYIIAKNASFFSNGKISDSDTEQLIKYMDNPSTLSVIIFTCYENIDARKKITKIFKEKKKIISVYNLPYDEIYQKSLELVKKNKYQISKENLQIILNACHNNYDLIYNELHKIFLYYSNPQEIQREDIINIISHSMEENNFKFIEAVVSKNMEKSLQILNDLYAIKVDSISLLILLAREYRLIYSALHLKSNGYRNLQIGKELGLQEWQVDKLLRESSNFYLDELKENISQLAFLDYQIKSGKMDKFTALKMFLLQAMGD